MANSKYEYVKRFELEDKILLNTYIVVRIDGRAFHKFTKDHDFEKPNDVRALNLMNEAAKSVMREFPEIVVAYGQSDEFSFVFKPTATVYQRRSSKIVSAIVSLFTATYVYAWPEFFPSKSLLKNMPSFDGRHVSYPTDINIRDYLAWRQVDCHINNLYNTSFWALVQQGGLSEKEAERELSGTFSNDKNELLFSRFGVNYSTLPEIFKKGSVITRRKVEREEVTAKGETVKRMRTEITVTHESMMTDEFFTGFIGPQ